VRASDGTTAAARPHRLDTAKAIAESLYDEFKEQLYSPPPLLLRMVDAGLLGKKNGRGFYEY
jgi:3-hydroxybutyryl-CoA dehydrogenase